MSHKPTLNLPWLEFIKLKEIKSLALTEQRSIFRKMSDPNHEIPWHVYKDLPHISTLNLQEQSQRYKIYLDELEKIRLEQLMVLKEQYLQFQDAQIEQQQTAINWLNNYATSQGGNPLRKLGRFNKPPHILLEDAEDILLEDSGLILLEGYSS